MYNDFKELLSALNAHQVRYLIVGGYAVSFHAEQRAQARGREEWLEFRRKQAEKSAGSTPESSREHDLTKDSEKGIDDDIEL
jgi:hypothetical protein